MNSADFLAADRAVVVPLVPRSLTEANPGYHDINEVMRLFADGAPIHIATHWIDGAVTVADRDYSCVHSHEEFAELNVILGEPDGLSYRIVARGDEPAITVEAPSAVVVPPGVGHSANVLQGRGWFVVVRVPIGAFKD